LTYTPEPIDTSKIILSNELNGLVEFLAMNTHENWSKERIRQGWQWGPKRNDKRKEHPCLIPYEQLPESEKEHDRIAAKELLKTIILRGFSIKKKKD
jgi:ryanodine receptor 2